MQQNKSPEVRTFRLKTKKKQTSIRFFSEEKAETNSSQSSFSSQYNLLTKKLKLKGKNLLNGKGMGSTLSSFCGQTSYRFKTQASCDRRYNQHSQNNLYLPFTLNHRSNQLLKTGTIRYPTALQKNSGLLNINNGAYRIKKTFKIHRPSIYCQIEEINKMQKSNEVSQRIIKSQLLISGQNSKSKNKFLQNCILLWNIRQQMNQKSNKIKPKDIIKAVKAYIMRKQQRDQPNNSMQKLFSAPEEQNQFKQLLCCQRLVIIGIAQLINSQKLHQICLQSIRIIDNLIGLYRYILHLIYPPTMLKKLFQSGFKDYEKFCKQTEQQKIDQKKSLTSTLLFMCTKLTTIYRYDIQLFKRLKVVLANSKKFSINRSFYELLTIYAVFLNQIEAENTNQNNTVNKYMKSFLTCPSPFIIQARTKRNYTLVLDLDQTLINTKFDSVANSKYCINYRPYCTQFVVNLAKHYEIIIFTSSISSYALEAITPFSASVSHVLCRQHTTKLKGSAIKDLSRIGRSLQTTIIIDNMSQNFKLQTQNGIEIKSWYGQKTDFQLRKLQQILIKVVNNNPKDIRQQLKLVLKSIQ